MKGRSLTLAKKFLNKTYVVKVLDYTHATCSTIAYKVSNA